ncbi:uncharacterized protein LOC128290562 [Gossypium arboreum]|uniref:uncharacterized protein LOC128290562 n=1 Tax=Gossypium arboreum TaxID=29729 RepID=UPI0022F1D2BB|nr:uncharacterized protein LOC128290562 [Gossypium arboreum]
MFTRLSLFDDGSLLAKLQVKATWTEQIKGKQLKDESLGPQFRQIESGETLDFGLNGGNKMYVDLCEVYRWSGLKRDWERVTMDFVSRLPLTPSKKDSVLVIVDRLAKSAHFISVHTDYSLQKLAKLYVSEIVRLYKVRRQYCVPPSDRWSVREVDSDIEGYVKKLCNRFLRQLGGLLAVSRRKKIEYSAGDLVFLNVSPWKKILRFGQKGKLSPRFIRPYYILKLVGPVAYQLELPPMLDRIHDVFHFSKLRRYHSDPTHIVSTKEIEVRPDPTFDEEPVQIIYRDVKVLRRKPVPLVKVLWCNHSSEEATWEP